MTSKFSKETIQKIKDAVKFYRKVFSDCKLVIKYATAEQRKQLKEEGLSGISKKERK